MGLISRVSSRTYRDERNLPRIAVEFSTTVSCFRGCEYWWTRHYCEEYRTCSCIRLLAISEVTLEVAIMNGNFEWIKEMFEKLSILPDRDPPQQNEGEEEPPIDTRPSTLEVAIAWGNLELVRLLLEYGVNLDGVNLGTLDGDIGDLCRQAQEGTLVNVYKVDAKKKKKK